MIRPVAIITMTADEVRALIKEAVAIALDDQRRQAASDAQALSASQAAKQAKCRRSTLIMALEAGALPGSRTGSRWSLLSADVAAWVLRGRPMAGKP